MQYPIKNMILFCPLMVLFCSGSLFAQDRTLEEFKEYASGKLSGMTDEQLTKLAKMVDKDSDGVITQAEFDDRMTALQKMQSGELDEQEETQEKEAEQTEKSNADAKRGDRRRSMNNRMQKRLDDAGIKPGNPLPDVAGLDIEGNPFPLSKLKGNYSVIVSGCLTWPPYIRNVPGLETVYRDYSSKGVKFYYLYKKLQHPGINSYVNPVSIEERLMHLKEAQEKLGTEFTWICDTMDNTVRDALGRLPNSEIVVDPQGKIVRARAWSNPKSLREDLEELIGPVDKVTTIADLDMNQQELGFDIEVATDVVKPLEIDSRMQNLKTVAQESEDPHFAKLHAQADAELLEDGTGKLYFALRLDPIYGVHWNNSVDPIQYELTGTDGVKITPARGDSPKVDAEADLDPREFVVDVRDATASGEIELTVKYFACTDDWCRPFTQSHTIVLEADRANDMARPGQRRRGGQRGKRRQRRR